MAERGYQVTFDYSNRWVSCSLGKDPLFCPGMLGPHSNLRKREGERGRGREREREGEGGRGGER